VTTENVAILFTDVVGSTELSQRLSAEAADEVRRGHFSLLRQAITESGGTEVKNLGDGLMVVFGSASAALGCAVAMQQGVEQENRGSENPVGLRVGLSGGEVSREDDDYFGDRVVEAARLCARCESGQVLASEWLRLTAGRRIRHECRSLGELTLKGLPDPVETVEVVWEPLGGADLKGAIPLPARLAVRPAVGVVGRGAEMTAITDALKRVTAGGGREVLLVSGEAGLGKTTLVAEAARAAIDNGTCVLFGHCEEDLATPYQLFAEALGHYVTFAPEEALLSHVAAHGSELSALVPALASRIPDLPASKATDTDTERFLLFAAVVGLLGATAQHQPVVVVFDDLQWADKGSLLLLAHLAAADPAMRVLVLGTYRDSELSNASALVDALASLRRHDGVSRIEMAGLDDTGVLALIEAGAGHPLDDAAVGLAHAIFRETDGNPFFVSEVLRNLVETGAIGQNAEGHWVARDSLDTTALPDSVREVIGARVLRLGKEAGRVLSVASVIGRDFDLDLLARATKTEQDDLLDLLEAASTAALVREPSDTSGRYAFAHALIQHTLYEDMGPNRRARAHRQVAEALEDLCGDRPGARVSELARHWVAATQPIDLEKAISYSRQAGDAALAALAPADALRHYAQALDLLYPQLSHPDPALGIDLAIGLGTAQRQTGDPAFRGTLLDASRRAADLHDTERLVAAALANDRGWMTSAGNIDADKVAVLEMALGRLAAEGPHRALVLATLCAELAYGPLETRRALADEAIAIANACGDDAVMVRVLNHLHPPLIVPSMLGESLVRTADALVRAERVGDPVLLFWAAVWRGDVAHRAGDLDEGDRCLNLMGALAEDLHQPTFSWTYQIWCAYRSLIAGDTDQAEQSANEALQIGTDGGEPDATIFYGGQLLYVAWQRGTVVDLIPLLDQMDADMADVPRQSIYAAIAAAHADAGQLDEARQLLWKLAAAGFDFRMDMNWTQAMVFCAEAAIECRDTRYAVPLFDHLAPWADQWSSTSIGSEGPISHYLGGLAAILGRYGEAETYFAQAAASSAKADAKFFAARTDLSWGRMLAERKGPGDTEEARRLLTQAHTAAVAHGYATVQRHAAAAVQALS
jgi:class 3 adenylate cyclase/tetratricopeptide (TPR) repeat protein